MSTHTHYREARAHSESVPMNFRVSGARKRSSQQNHFDVILAEKTFQISFTIKSQVNFERFLEFLCHVQARTLCNFGIQAARIHFFTENGIVITTFHRSEYQWHDFDAAGLATELRDVAHHIYAPAIPNITILNQLSEHDKYLWAREAAKFIAPAEIASKDSSSLHNQTVREFMLMLNNLQRGRNADGTRRPVRLTTPMYKLMYYMKSWLGMQGVLQVANTFEDSDVARYERKRPGELHRRVEQLEKDIQEFKEIEEAKARASKEGVEAMERVTYDLLKRKEELDSTLEDVERERRRERERERRASSELESKAKEEAKAREAEEKARKEAEEAEEEIKAKEAEEKAREAAKEEAEEKARKEAEEEAKAREAEEKKHLLEEAKEIEEAIKRKAAARVISRLKREAEIKDLQIKRLQDKTDKATDLIHRLQESRKKHRTPSIKTFKRRATHYGTAVPLVESPLDR